LSSRPVTALIILGIIVTVTATTIYASNSGILDQILNRSKGNEPLINGTILNKDNKTYYILIVPTEKNVTIPVPPPQPQPVPTPPPVINNTGDNDTVPNPEPAPTPAPTPVPQPVPNKPPVLTVDTPIKCIVDNACTMTIEEIKDIDGKIANIIWNQESGASVGFSTSTDKHTATFTPQKADIYVFSVEAQDDDGATVLKSVTVNVPTPPAPAPQPVPQPTPAPVPTAEERTVIVVGDLDDNTAGTNTFKSIAAKKPDVVIALGDLGYGDTLAWYKSTYGKLNSLCVPGNHESANEDGTTSLQAETLKYCSNPFYFKLNNILFLGINTNGDLTKQLAEASAVLSDPKQMQGIKEVHLETHKPCATPPNPHHPVESKVKTFCDSLKTKVPTGVKFVNDAGHNHVLSASKDGMYKTSGAGGRSHYTCGVSTYFTFCDNVHFGYLQYTIKPDGTNTYVFYDYNGKVVQ